MTTIVKLYKSNSDALYLQADEGTVWDGGNDLASDTFVIDAAAWAEGEWEPSEANGWTATTSDGLTLVASWSPQSGLVLHVAPDTLGGTQEEYIGPLVTDSLPVDHHGRCTALLDEWRAANRKAEADELDDDALLSRFMEIEAQYRPQIVALGYSILMQGFKPERAISKLGGLGGLLEEIEAEASAIEAAERTIAERTARRDELIRAALRTELPRAAIAEAAGLKEARLYQIRDGRR